MKVTKEQLEQAKRLEQAIKGNQFFDHLGVIGECFIEFMNEQDDAELMNAYLDYINWCKEQEIEHQKYPVYCLMAMSKMIIQLQADGEIDL